MLNVKENQGERQNKGNQLYREAETRQGSKCSQELW